MSDEHLVFRFNSAVAAESEKELDRRLEYYDSRISRLVDGIKLGGASVLGPLLGLSHDPEELNRVGEALCRLAPLVGAHDELVAQKKIFELARRKPEKLLAMFADFEGDVEEDLKHFTWEAEGNGT